VKRGEEEESVNERESLEVKKISGSVVASSIKGIGKEGVQESKN